MDENNEIPHLPKELIESFGALSEMGAQQGDIAAANLYRAMFRGERSLNKLDYWGDGVLDGIMWNESCKEDYLNYLRYLEAHDKEIAQRHRELYEETIKEDIDGDELEE